MYDVPDIRWTYAAYRLGAFEDAFDPDLTPLEFESAFVDKVSNAVEVFSLFAQNDRGGPVGVAPVMMGQREDHWWPHVVWYPWASKRNRLEATVKFLNTARREVKLLIAADRESRSFFEHVASYGVMRRIGTSKEWDGEDALLFETRKPI